MKRELHRAGGFTLVEMIAVLLILALLAAAVTGGLARVRENTWRLRARDTCRQLCAAWNMYLVDEHKFPSELGTAQKVKADKKSLSHLLGEASSKRVYLELDDERDKDGLLDHWGQTLSFSLDTDYNGLVDNPYPDAFDPELPEVRASSVAWSEGNPKHKKRDDNPIVAW